MTTIAIAARDDLPPASEHYAVAHCGVSGVVRSALYALGDHSLWAAKASLEAAAQLTWRSPHGDEAIFVRTGRLTVGDAVCSEGGTVIIEAGARCVVRADADTDLFHFGPREPRPRTQGLRGAPGTEAHGVHVVPVDGGYLRSREGAPLDSHMYADSCCDTCRINFFRVIGHGAYRTPSHLHSEDEIILVLDGEIRVGRDVLGPGTAIAIPGGYRYSYRASAPYAFLNYRADMSTVTMAPGSEPVLESERPTGVTL